MIKSVLLPTTLVFVPVAVAHRQSTAAGSS